MEFGPAVHVFVPLLIFAPLILLPLIELWRTPKPDTTRRAAVQPAAGAPRA